MTLGEVLAGDDRVPRAQGHRLAAARRRADPLAGRSASRGSSSTPSFDRPLTEAERAVARAARRAARPPRAARLRPRRLGLPAAHAAAPTPARSCPRPETEIVVERALARDRRARGAAGRRRRHRERRDRARDRRRAPRRARHRDRHLAGRARARARERRARSGSRSSFVETSLLDGLDGPVRPRRLEPALRRRGRGATRSSRRCATGSRGSRSSATARPSELARGGPRACSHRAARSCSSATPSTRGHVAALLDGARLRGGYDHDGSRRKGEGGRGAMEPKT